MTNDVRYPVVFDASPLGAGAGELLEDPSLALLVEFFQAKGLTALKEESREAAWYPDWIAFQAEHGIYASLLSPAQWSTKGNRFALRRLARFLEVFAYFSPAHAYSLHVSFLGIFPILMGQRAALKQEAVERLEQGGLFGFAVSEQAHGSDLFSNEFTIRPHGPESWIANGSKYYIGNARDACMLSVLARQDDASASKRAPFAFVAVRPQDTPVLENVRKIHTIGIRQAFVGEFEVHDYELPESDIISIGRHAWNATFTTVDFGKLLLGFGAIGICEHAFAEAWAHMRARTLYGAPVTDIAHIQRSTAIAFARLFAMKLYADRALDYLQASSKKERRYLLYNAVQKARVSTEGVKVVDLLSACVGARGTESETYFESALRDVQLIPGLEGSTHINFGQTAQFAAPYFAGPGDAPPPPAPARIDASAGENPYWTAAHNRNPKSVHFDDWRRSFEPLRHVPNVGVFEGQVGALARFVGQLADASDVAHDPNVLLEKGRCLSVVAFAQLVAENAADVRPEPEMLALIFHTLVMDLAEEALRLSAVLPPSSPLRETLQGCVTVPVTTSDDIDGVSRQVATHYGSV